ncbi:MAG: ArsR family transcriptional regulator [Methanoregula sp.]
MKMREERIILFSDREEEIVNLLIKIGTGRNIASTLVFLARTHEATSREIERGTTMQQPAVSIAMKYLIERHWVTSCEIPSVWKARPMKKYSLAISFKEILAVITKEKKREANNHLEVIQKLREEIVTVPV